MANRDRVSFGIHAYLNRLAYVVINVSDLKRALPFYEGVFPVRRHCRLNGPPQPFRALGVEYGHFEGVVLRSLTAERAPGNVFAEAAPRDLHLVEWKTPTPLGSPYREANHVGIYRHNTLVGDIEAGHARVLAHGGRPYGPPSRILLDPAGSSVVCFGFRDPDGSTLEMIGPDRPDANYPGALHHCNINCTDLDRSYRFYHDVLGFDSGILCMPGSPQAARNGSLGDTLKHPDGAAYVGTDMDFKANLLIPRNDWRTPLDVLEWTLPKPYGQAYASPFNLGIARVGIEVSDIEAAQARLCAANIGPVSDVESWDLGEFGQRRVATFRDPDGVMLEIVDPIDPMAAQLASVSKR